MFWQLGLDKTDTLRTLYDKASKLTSSQNATIQAQVSYLSFFSKLPLMCVALFFLVMPRAFGSTHTKCCSIMSWHPTYHSSHIIYTSPLVQMKKKKELETVVRNQSMTIRSSKSEEERVSRLNSALSEQV